MFQKESERSGSSLVSKFASQAYPVPTWPSVIVDVLFGTNKTLVYFFGKIKTLVSQLSHLAPKPSSFFMVTRNLATSTKMHNFECVNVLSYSCSLYKVYTAIFDSEYVLF